MTALAYTFDRQWADVGYQILKPPCCDECEAPVEKSAKEIIEAFVANYVPPLPEHVVDPQTAIQKFLSRRAHTHDWNEQEHPRGQPDNEGQFAEKPGGNHLPAHRVGGELVDAGGELLPAHIQKLKIPPAWSDVTYSPDPDSPLQAKGKDAAGRVQYVYSAAHSSKQAAAKFARIKELEQKFEHIKAQNDALRMDHDPRVRDLADVTMLIMATGIRPGSMTDTKAKVQAYGATTLRGRHVVQNANGVSLSFVGKKGVQIDLPITDKEVAKMLLQRAKRTRPDGMLFTHADEGSLLAHVHSFDGGGFKTKDFRTLVGTRTAMAEMKKVPTPTNQTAYRKAVMAVAKRVSAKLGNTPTVALQSYISPAVFAPWQGANL